MSVDGDYKSVELKQLATQLLANNKSPDSFIDKYSTVVVLPNDSHTPFARHIASYNIKTELKRYCVSHVYNCSLIGPPPEPNTESAFDVVSPPSAGSSELRKADAEVVQVIQNVLKDCGLPSVVIKLSHCSLLQAVLKYCNIPNDDQTAKVFRQAKEELERFNRPREFLLDDQMELLLSLFIIHGELNEVKTKLSNLPDWTKSEAASMAQKAFDELEGILSNLTRSEDDRESYRLYIDLSVGIEKHNALSGFDGFLFNFVYKEYEDQ